MILRQPEKVNKPDNTWTSVIAAFLRPISTPPTSDTISKESTNDTKSQSSIPILTVAKPRCNQCHRKLTGAFTGKECLQPKCPQQEDKEQYDVLTFKDWKDAPFEVIETLECTPEPYQWPTAGADAMVWDPFEKKWKAKAAWGWENDYC